MTILTQPTSDELRHVVVQIDDAFGTGYAMAHPELVAAFIQANATTDAANLMGESLAGLASALNGIGGAIEDAGRELITTREELTEHEGKLAKGE